MKNLVKVVCFLIVLSMTNISIKAEDKEYKVVEFVGENGCVLDIAYDSRNSINGCLGIDAAYLYEKDNQVYFMQAGAIGHISSDRVNVLDVNDYLDRLSSYQIINGSLYHNIKTDLQSTYYSYSLAIDKAPSYLKEGIKYYSYDGHYFYDDYHKMIDDYLSQDYSCAINKEPYYNYYQYLPFRSISNYSYEEINDYFLNKLHIDSKLDSYIDLNDDGANDIINKSQCYKELESFFVSEEAYGVNSMLLLSMSMYESSFGKSLNAYLANNLFSSAAFSSSKQELSQSYDTIAQSVYAFSKYYVIDRNTNPIRNSYNGSFIGNKESGMNKAYSNDPYWADKVISNYYMMDLALGFKDKDSLMIGLVDNPRVYKDELLDDLLYKKDGNDYAYVILEENDETYTIQLDKSIDGSFNYDYEKNIAYINKDEVRLIGSNNISNKEYSKYQYDFDGGLVDGNTNLMLQTNKEVVKPTPQKEGYEFVEYQDSKAVYKEVTTIALSSGFKEEIELGSIIDLKDAKLLVHYQDGTYKYVDITSEMVDSFDDSKTDNSIVSINYCGKTLDVPLSVSQWPKLIKADVRNEMKNLREALSVDNEKLSYIRRNINGIDLDFADIRYLDSLCLNDKNASLTYIIQENEYDLSMSGLSLALYRDKKNPDFHLYNDTYYVRAKEANKNSVDKLSNFAKDYGFNIEGSINLSFRYNLVKVEPNAPIVTQVKIDDKSNDTYYSVYHLDHSGNIVKVKTTQSNSYIQFLAYESGDYIFMSLPGGNVYDIPDKQENISFMNNGIDSFAIMLEILIFFSLLLYNFVCIIMYFMLEKNREKRWNVYRKSLRQAESVREEKLKS